MLYKSPFEISNFNFDSYKLKFEVRNSKLLVQLCSSLLSLQSGTMSHNLWFGNDKFRLDAKFGSHSKHFSWDSVQFTSESKKRGIEGSKKMIFNGFIKNCL